MELSCHPTGLDLSGVVEAVGDDVTNVKVGDEVFSFVPSAGAFAEYALLEASKLSKRPEALSFEVAAAFPCVGSTTYQAVTDVGQVTQGTKLLVLGGSTAVGGIAIQVEAKRCLCCDHSQHPSI